MSAQHEAGGVLRWDAHSCVPLKATYQLDVLQRHRRAGFDFVSINVGMDFNPIAQIMQVIASFRAQIDRSADLALASSVADIVAARAAGKLALAFDLEGAVPLLTSPAMVGLFHQLGIRQMHFAYNRGNPVAGGCYEPEAPLSALGIEMLRACEEVGMVVDCSHLNEQSALAIMAAARKPVVFSHSNVRGLNGNYRNITDDMVVACAETGGVIGVTGMSSLLPHGHADASAMLDVIDYLVGLVSIEHIGIGLDYVYDLESDELPEGVDSKYWYPPEFGYSDSYYKSLQFVPPECTAVLLRGLQERGYGEAAIAAVLGGNFTRVAQACW